MAIENVVKLIQAAQEKPELASKLEAVTSTEQVVEIGAVEGLEFTTEEAEAFRQKLIKIIQKAEEGELTEEELEAAAGGGMADDYCNFMSSIFGPGTKAGKAIDKTGNWMFNTLNPIMGPNTTLGKSADWVNKNVEQPMTNFAEKAVSKVFSGW